MPDTYLDLSAREQRNILQSAATELGRQAQVLEKDVWLCWVLAQLFSIPDAHPMAFKGGTSLSKVFNVINRFSEDVDITLDYRYFNDDFNPMAAGVSNTQIKKFGERLKMYVAQQAADVIVPNLQQAVERLPCTDQMSVVCGDSGEGIYVVYPSVVAVANDYVKPHVYIELGGRNVIDPNDQGQISPDITAVVPGLELPVANVVVLSPERTFWEKATLIHVECHRGRMKDDPQRLSRHWYDLFMLSKHSIGESAILNRSLLEDVVAHKEVFFNASYASYQDCVNAALRLVPADEDLSGLQQDYTKMQSAGMLYGEVPDFDELVATLTELENRING